MEKHRIEFAKDNIKNIKNKLELAQKCLDSAIENVDNFKYIIDLIDKDCHCER